MNHQTVCVGRSGAMVVGLVFVVVDCVVDFIPRTVIPSPGKAVTLQKTQNGFRSPKGSISTDVLSSKPRDTHSLHVRATEIECVQNSIFKVKRKCVCVLSLSLPEMLFKNTLLANSMTRYSNKNVLHLLYH